jgi:hypothetical protein
LAIANRRGLEMSSFATPEKHGATATRWQQPSKAAASVPRRQLEGQGSGTPARLSARVFSASRRVGAEKALCVGEASDRLGVAGRSGFAFAGGRLKYGETAWSARTSATFPSLVIKWTRSGKDWTAEVQPTSATMGPVQMTFLPPGTHRVPGKLVQANDPQCGPKGKRVPFYTEVSAAMSNLARLAEEEHRSDYQRAYDLTLKKCADQINAIAGQSFGPGTKGKVEQEIVKQIGGKKPSQWVTKELNRLKALSEQRDTRGWHRLISDGQPVTCPPDCSKVVGTTIVASTTQVPGPPSSQLIA